MSLLSLPHSPCHIPTSLSSPPAPTSPPSASSTSVARSRCQSTSAPARWRESDGLADSSPHTRMMRDPRAQGNLLQIHKSSLHAEGFLYFYRWRRSPIDATFSVESCKGQRIDVESVMSMKAALHFGKGFVKNSEIHLNTKLENIESVFDITHIFDTGTV